MKVLKFGGTSVGTAQRIKDVANLISTRGKNIVVLSAMSGTTNSLIEISDYLYKRNVEGAKEIINALENKYRRVIDELYTTEEFKLLASNEIRDCFNYIRSFSKDLFTLFEEKEILSRGEIMSVALMYHYLREQHVDVALLPSLEYMRTDKNSEPDTQYIKEKLETLLERNADAALYLTHG